MKVQVDTQIVISREELEKIVLDYVCTAFPNKPFDTVEWSVSDSNVMYCRTFRPS